MTERPFFLDDIITGSLLGDGTLTFPKYGNCAFVKNQSRERKEYLEWHYKSFGSLSSSLKDGVSRCKGKTYPRSIFRTKSHVDFTRLRDVWYQDRVKVIPSNLKLTSLTLAVWFCDDGTNDFDNRACKFATQSFSKNECDHLISLLESFSFRASLHKGMA